MERIYTRYEVEPLDQGEIYLEFVIDGKIHYVKDENFGMDLEEALSSADRYVQMEYFLLGKDMARGRIPRARVFALDGILYKLKDIPVNGISRGTFAVAEEVFSRKHIEIQGGRAVSARPSYKSPYALPKKA
ncbi:MAG: hypothetical protein A3A51_00660 [Candidatus Levybacteria bacterium RIFCSPLOWO2_01_FULL_39_10]|nr:MAG: hypothetical protein A3A51_00660 [Candidatus Levybacteria bacterium RIFCSPLOWO2_01_FULL_39_10]